MTVEINELFSVAGMKVLVTGAGRGLGFELSSSLKLAGAQVFGTSRDEKTAAEISARLGTPPLVLDQKNPAEISEFVRKLWDEHGPIEGLVNNAGVNRPKPSSEVTAADWEEIMGANLAGPFFLSQAFYREWTEKAVNGRIVNISSQAGVVAIENRSPYGASKAGLIHLTKSLAAEWASDGIRVNAIAPTFIRTEMTKKSLEDSDFSSVLLSRIPVGRFGEPADLVAGTIYLLSPGSEFMTGQTLLIDGGYTLR
jgi:NAD(P)-dependent dehydrogenase (short-subunit alcohol dehydrogenase family)